MSTGSLEPGAAVDAIEACFRRMAAGEVEIAPRRRLRLPEGALADMAASDSGLGLAGGKLYAATASGATFVVCLFDSESSELVAVIEADRLGQLRTGAASGVAARHLARADARTLGVIGCGHQAETQVACIRAAVPTIERVVAYCRTPEKLAAFCDKVGAEPGESHRDAAAGDVVVTITSSRDPVLRGEWLSAGTLVAAAGANVVNRRELDNAVLERARFVCCDWLEQAKLESGDLVEPVQAGVLDWLEVHELHEVVSRRDRRPSVGRRHRPLQVERAGRMGRRSGRGGGASRAGARRRNGSLGRQRGLRGLEHVPAERLDDLRPIEQSALLLGRDAVLDVPVLEDLVQRPAALVLADDVPCDVLFCGASREQKRERVLEQGHETRLYPGGMRRSSREGRYAERLLVGVDDVGDEERIAIWIERRPGAVWAVGRAVNPQLRESDETRPEDLIFEGYELGDALDRANEALEDDVNVLEADGRPADARPFTRKEVLPLLERWFFNR